MRSRRRRPRAPHAVGAASICLALISACDTQVTTETLIVENRTDLTLTIVKVTPTEQVTLQPTAAPHTRVLTDSTKCATAPLSGPPQESYGEQIAAYLRSISHEARTSSGTVVATLPYSEDCDPDEPWIIEP